jgi:hypothetical protein
MVEPHADLGVVPYRRPGGASWYVDQEQFQKPVALWSGVRCLNRGVLIVVSACSVEETPTRCMVGYIEDVSIPEDLKSRLAVRVCRRTSGSTE